MKKGLFLVMALIQVVFTQNTSALTVNLHDARGFKAIERQKLDRSLALVEQVMNSTQFRDRVLNFKNMNGNTEYHQNEGMTNQEIYNLLMSGAEKYPTQGAADGQMDYELQIYSPKWYQSKKVIGYTDPSYLTIFMNRRFYKTFIAPNIVGNLVHEWIHKMGFGHDFRYNVQRDYSVPYAIGYIAEEVAEELQN
jgi:hypothetical protein